MELLNATGMQAAYTMGTDPSAREHLVVAVKGTLAIPDDGGPATLMAEQAPSCDGGLRRARFFLAALRGRFGAAQAEMRCAPERHGLRPAWPVRAECPGRGEARQLGQDLRRHERSRLAAARRHLRPPSALPLNASARARSCRSGTHPLPPGQRATVPKLVPTSHAQNTMARNRTQPTVATNSQAGYSSCRPTDVLDDLMRL
jgi:hypothetical protein